MSKTIFITGSTDGIGKLSALKLAKAGHQVNIHGRNPEKVSKVVSEIKSQSKNEKVKGFVSDLSRLEDLNELAQTIGRELTKIDVLINNAGVYNSPIPQNNKGLDMRFAVNYLAPYLLTTDLIPLLNKGTEPRIINLSSAAQSPVSLKALSGEERLSANQAYAQSKLALTMWSFYLSGKLQQISVIAVNPGSLLNTKMVEEAFGNYWSPADKGADILFDLAVSEEFKGFSGKYFDNDSGTFGRTHPDAYSDQKVQQLIEATSELLFERNLVG